MRSDHPPTKVKHRKAELASIPSVPTTEGLILLCHPWPSERPSALSVTRSAVLTAKAERAGGEKKKKNLATGGAKPSAPFPLSTSSPPLPYSAMCHLQVVWERDLVTFECPIKRRGSVRAPLRVPFRHVTDEQAAIFPVNRTHSHANTFLPPPDSFSCLLPPSVLPVFLHKHSLLPGKRSPTDLIAALPLEQEVTTV